MSASLVHKRKRTNLKHHSHVSAMRVHTSTLDSWLRSGSTVKRGRRASGHCLTGPRAETTLNTVEEYNMDQSRKRIRRRTCASKSMEIGGFERKETEKEQRSEKDARCPVLTAFPGAMI